MNRWILLFVLIAAPVQRASAHFVFVIPQADGKGASVVLSEELKPGEEVDIAIIQGAKLVLRDSAGHESPPLAMTRREHALEMSLPGPADGVRVIRGVADLGVMKRGEAKPHVLVYYPKTILGDPFDTRTQLGAELAPVEIVPAGTPASLKLKFLANGKPQANTEMTVILPGGEQKAVTTDAEGLTPALGGPGRYGAWARNWETNAGQRDGKPFDEIRRYATLVIDVPGSSRGAAPTSAPTAAAAFKGLPVTPFASMPQAASSFGAVVCDGWLYVFGGHIVPTHSYSTEAVSGKFARLNLSDGKTWETLPSGTAMQGMNLATHGGKVYLIGGMEPRNKPDADADTHSIPECARFDPKTGQWEKLPPLPEGRSSHDIVVIGDQLIVVGGWTLKGIHGETQWPTTINIMDLSIAKPAWTSRKQPFNRRALIATVHKDRLYVIGGFDDGENVLRAVSIYDPKTNAWTAGPDLPGSERNGFGPATCSVNGSLYISLGDGSLNMLDESTNRWKQVAQTTPRIVHRMTARNNSELLIIGGAAAGGNMDLIESVSLAPSSRAVDAQNR